MTKTDEELSSSVQSKLVIDGDKKDEKFDRWSLSTKPIEYGYLSASKTPPGNGGFYLTTAINYTNGPAHMGHAYEATTSDVISRYARLTTPSSYFLTGSDEHGQKIANTAEDQKKQPIDICDLYVRGFQVLNERALISNDDYVRTTSDRHKRTAHALWNRCASKNDIYLDVYSGWYNVREETFVTDSDAKLMDYKDSTTGLPLKQVKEESYFFKMSEYHDKLVDHITNNPEFIRPESHRQAILKRLQDDRLRDLSVSRTTFTWGIPVPDGFDQKHVMYVWFDALTNYLTGVNALGVNNDDEGDANSNLGKMWPADVHIIGKDILWFHAVIWPCILMSAELELPKTIFAHGFVNDKEGKKMSKSIGNVVDPHDMLDLFPVDSFRWYLCKEAPYGGELSFSEESLRTMHNADLCDTLGNLIHRATNLCKNYCNGLIPDVPPPSPAPLDFHTLRQNFIDKMTNYQLHQGAEIAIAGFRDVNGYLTEKAPWHMKGEEFAEERKLVVRATLEAIYALSHLLLPFIPNGAGQIFQKLGLEPKGLEELDGAMRNLVVGSKVVVGDVLYKKILSDEELSAAETALKKKESYAAAQKAKKEKKAKLKAASTAGQQKTTDDPNQPLFARMLIKVGKITKVWVHPNAEKLYCEEIDLGEEMGVRQICSGLRAHYTMDQMQDRKVLVVCNLKSSKMLGFDSQGMVLAAKSDDGSAVELVCPPKDADVGERVFLEGMVQGEGEPFSPAQVKKKKTWDAVAKLLKTGDGGVAMWDNKIIVTSKGSCKADTLVGAPIS